MHRRERISEGKKKIKMILPNIFHRWFLCSKLENTKKTPEKTYRLHRNAKFNKCINLRTIVVQLFLRQRDKPICKIIMLTEKQTRLQISQ